MLSPRSQGLLEVKSITVEWTIPGTSTCLQMMRYEQDTDLLSHSCQRDYELEVVVRMTRLAVSKSLGYEAFKQDNQQDRTHARM